ncbi:MAG: hypothetical protein P4L79_15885 [Legionella sp.]|uniref:hypothetical protein n=1 Tax=Legionella sp. TaxID=459 RepID=UPI002849B782|nr:hypothetical protein [Legionella sp.]
MIHALVSMTEVTKFAWCKMKKLCIHIYTSYSDYTKNEQTLLWDNEVNKDAQTVRAVFNEDTIVDIPVTAVTDKQKKNLNIGEALDPLREIQLANYDECHIVLNTHGAAGVNDLSDEVVKAVVSLVSNHEIKITQISALQCNGLKGLTASEYRQKNQMTPQHQNVADKPASMSILQGKLGNLETKIEQSFSIHGFMEAYDPVIESSKVVALLLHGSKKSLSVKTKLPKEDDLQALRSYIDICRTCTDKASKDYMNATNKLGKILHKMTQNICLYLQGKEDFDDRNKILLETIFPDPTDRSNATDLDFEHGYKRWLKNHKATSVERLTVFEDYCHMEQAKVELEQSSSTPISISALCHGKLGHFTQNASKNAFKSVGRPELERSCTL